ncbi:hypothetical protein Dimus_008381, partial [Dionaea muscipula]
RCVLLLLVVMEWAALGDGEMGRRGWWWLMEARMGDGGVVGADGGGLVVVSRQGWVMVVLSVPMEVVWWLFLGDGQVWFSVMNRGWATLSLFFLGGSCC